MPDDLDPFDVAALGLAEHMHPASTAVPAPRAVKTDEGDKARYADRVATRAEEV
jgi:hypothetical protein